MVERDARRGGEEVVRAVGGKRPEAGDLLLQAIYHAQMADEEGSFTFDDVVEAICTKMIRRHPHVFGDERARSAKLAEGFWEDIKAKERKSASRRAGVLEGIPLALPGLTRAVKLQAKGAKVGFDWPDAQRVLVKLDEERAELEEAIAGGNEDEILDEMGDLLFVCANIARKLKVAPEDALQRANAKFSRRFTHVEARAKATGRTCDLDELESFWVEAKAIERG